VPEGCPPGGFQLSPIQLKPGERLGIGIAAAYKNVAWDQIFLTIESQGFFGKRRYFSWRGMVQRTWGKE